jgi:hypothetical protein
VRAVGEPDRVSIHRGVAAEHEHLCDRAYREPDVVPLPHRAPELLETGEPADSRHDDHGNERSDADGQEGAAHADARDVGHASLRASAPRPAPATTSSTK